MNDYREVRLNITPSNEDASDIMAAILAEIDYESFVPDQQGLTAYIRAEKFDAAALAQAINEFPIPGYSVTTESELIEGRDWNSEWEKNYFKPIVVGENQCVIHSSFHRDFPTCRYDIVIDPKMAFGTGHHATTSLIIEQLLAIDIEGKSVIDMGTGTGILAILAAMRGATPVTAIEIDPAAEINAEENVATNGHPEIQVLLGDASLLPDEETVGNIEPADIFIANINRNIITGDIAAYARALRPGGIMLLSGFYESDIPIVCDAAAQFGLTEYGHTVKGDNWTCLRLHKK